MMTRSAEERGGGKNGSSVHSDPSVQRGMQLLSKCAAYCVNEDECRRVLLLRYFGEEFSQEACHGTCDNCRRCVLTCGRARLWRDMKKDVGCAAMC